MPDTCRKIIASLGQDYEAERAKGLGKLREWGGLEMGKDLPEPKPLFPRIA